MRKKSRRRRRFTEGWIIEGVEESRAGEGWKRSGGVVMVTKVEEAGMEGGKFGQREEVECEAGMNVGKMS